MLTATKFTLSEMRYSVLDSFRSPPRAVELVDLSGISLRLVGRWLGPGVA
jgi:hypothetical protein